jgi:hypothetical protein
MKKITAALALATSLLASGSAVAAVDFVGYESNLSSNTIGVAKATITLSSSDPSFKLVNAWYDVVPSTRQSKAAIAAGVNTATGESFAASDLDKIVTSGKSYTYDPAGNSVFNFLALHIGAGTLLFEFQNAISDLTITTSGRAAGISNVFGFPDGGQSEVPVPGAIWLLGTALLGFIGLSRRKAISAA